MDEAMEAVKRMKNRSQKQTKEVSVTFAGQNFKISQQVSSGNELDSLVSLIDGKDKNVTTYQKSKMDWEKHTKEEKLEDSLE